MFSVSIQWLKIPMDGLSDSKFLLSIQWLKIPMDELILIWFTCTFIRWWRLIVLLSKSSTSEKSSGSCICEKKEAHFLLLLKLPKSLSDSNVLIATICTQKKGIVLYICNMCIYSHIETALFSTTAVFWSRALQTQVKTA